MRSAETGTTEDFASTIARFCVKEADYDIFLNMMYVVGNESIKEQILCNRGLFRRMLIHVTIFCASGKCDWFH